MSDAVLQAEARLKDFISGNLKQIESNLQTFAKKAQQAGKDASDSGKSAGSSFSDLSNKVGLLKGAFVAATPVIAGLGLFKLAKDASDVGSKFYDMSNKVGIGTEYLSAMDYVAKQSGSSIDALVPSFKKLSVNAYEAATKGGDLKTAFASLGIEMNKSTINTKSQEEILKTTLLRLSEVKNGTEQVALAQKLFGKAGTDLIPILKQGSKSIEEQMQQAKDLGITWSESAAANADNFGDRIGELNAQFQGLLKQGITPLFGPFTTLMNAMSVGMAALDVTISSNILSWGKAFRGLGQMMKGEFSEGWKTMSTITDEERANLQSKTKALEAAWNKYIEDGHYNAPTPVKKKGGGEVTTTKSSEELAAEKEKSAKLIEEQKAHAQKAFEVSLQNRSRIAEANLVGLDLELEQLEIQKIQERAAITDQYQQGLMDRQTYNDQLQVLDNLYYAKKQEAEINNMMAIDEIKEENRLKEKEANEKAAAKIKEDTEKSIELAGQKLQALAGLFGGVSELITALGGKNRKAAIAAKALAIGEAIINTSVGVTKAFAQGGVLGFVTGAGIVAAGAASVAKIASTKLGVGGPVQGATHANGGVNVNLEGGEYVIRKEDVNSLGGFSKVRSLINGNGSSNIVDARANINITLNGNTDNDTIKNLSNTLNESYDNYLIKLEKGMRDIKTRGLVI